MRRMSPACRAMTSAYCSSATRSASGSFDALRRSRSADSWIGVSGFLISCAIRRATSPHAAMRCAATRSVRSSMVSTLPASGSPALGVMRASNSRPRPCTARWIWSCALPPMLRSARARRAARAGTASSMATPSLRSRSRPSISAAAAFIRSIRPSPSRPTTPALTPESTVSIRRRRASVSRLAASRSARCCLSCAVMALKARDSTAISSAPFGSRTRRSRSPPPTSCAAEASPSIGLASRSASRRPVQVAPRITTTAKPR